MMLAPAILALVIGAPHVKPVELAALRKESSLKTSDELIRYLQSLDLEVSAAKTWIPTREDYPGRRAFWITCKDQQNKVICEVGFLAWYPTDDKANMAAMLVNGGYFVSPLYSGTNYTYWQTLSQYWPRKGPNRWEVIVLAHADSSVIKAPIARRIGAFLGEKTDWM